MRKPHKDQGRQEHLETAALRPGRVTAAGELPDAPGSEIEAAGIFKLKQHVDNPAQAPMKDGV